MSKSMYIDYHGEGFWAYDVAAGVFLKHLIDRACVRPPAAWLDDCIELWRLDVVVSDIGVHLDPEWTELQRRTVLELIEEACRELQQVTSYSAEEAASWQIYKGEGVWARGAAEIPTAPAFELGRAISLLLQGKLPAAPAGTWWFYGFPGGVTTIRKRSDA